MGGTGCRTAINCTLKLKWTINLYLESCWAVWATVYLSITLLFKSQVLELPSCYMFQQNEMGFFSCYIYSYLRMFTSYVHKNVKNNGSEVLQLDKFHCKGFCAFMMFISTFVWSCLHWNVGTPVYYVTQIII